MKRPYLSQSIEGLERLFADRGSDPDVLASLLVELKSRSTDRARRLMNSVIAAQSALVKAQEDLRTSATGTDGMASNVVRGMFSTGSAVGATDRLRIVEANVPVEPLRAEPRRAAPQDDEQRRLAAIFDALRIRLLDLTLRNPMLNYKPQSRSRRHLQIVDDALEDVFRRLAVEELQVDIIPLPEPADIPEDEKTDEFTSELAHLKATDVDYQVALAALASGARDDDFEVAKLDRLLRDRLRTILGMPARPPRNQIDLNEHARQNKINPAIDLDSNGPKQGARRNKLQSLLLAESLRTRMGAIRDIARLSEQEMGFSTLYIAFGFIEWYEKADSEKALFAPLLLLPVKLGVRTETGKKIYSIKATSEAASHNVTLKKRLEEMDRVLPDFEADSDVAHPIEAYFSGVRAAINGLPRWRIRSFLTLGHFAFGRLAMFQDIDPNQWAMAPSQHDLVGAILRGTESRGSVEGEALPRIPDDYEIDGEEVSRLAPLLVHDADASQHSAIVDVMKRQNLVIEGPPGTGKSQTITNIIANVLSRDGTTSVLFLSEKRAALEVVKRRLDGAKLGTFCLELHSEKSSPSEVIDSLRERLESRSPSRPANEMSEQAWNTARAELAEYITELHTPDEDGETAFALFWKSIAGDDPNADVPKDVRKAEIAESLLANPTEQRRLLAEVQYFGSLAGDFIQRHGPRNQSPWAKLPLRARPGAYEDVLDDLRGLHAAVLKGLPAAQEAAGHGLDYLDEVGLQAVGRIPTPPSLENVVQIAQIEPNEIERALALLAPLRKIEAELASDPLDGAISAEEIEAAARLARQALESSQLALAAHEIQRRADETTRRAEQVIYRIDATRQMRGLLKIDDNAPFEILPAVCVAAIATAAVPVLMRGWLSWKPSGEERQYSQARERWLSLSSAERQWGERLNGYDTAARPNPAELRSASAILSEKGIGLKPWRRGDLKKARETASGLGLSSPDAPTVLNDFASHLEALSEFERSTAFAQAIGPLWKGLRTDFESMDNALKMKSFISGKLNPLEHGSQVAEKLFNLDDASVTALIAEKDVALANRKGASDADEKFVGYSISQLHEAMRKDRREALALRANEDLRALAEVEAPLGTIIARSRRVAERDRLAAQISRFDAATKLEGMVRHARDVEGIAAVAEWIKSVRSSTLPKATVERLLNPDGAEFRSTLRRVAEQAMQALQDEQAASAVILQRYRSNLLDIPRDVLSATLTSALARNSELREFLALEDARRVVDESGLRSFMTAIEATELSSSRYSDVLAYVLVRRRAERLHKAGHKLSNTSGLELNGRRKVFADQDKRKIARDRMRAYQSLSGRRPPDGNRTGAQKHWTEMALIHAEAAKENRFMKVRTLLQQAKGAVRALKPCFMMSPMSVAKFLPRDMIFDVVIIDEASQMRPEDALGALLRARQIVVVGDPKQLPPTDFFDRAMDSDDLDGDEEKDDLNDESILEACAKSFNAVRNLKWHYRSRCESLIAFSNEQFYKKSLITFPMAQPGSFSVDLVQVEGAYQANQNPAEAQRIIEEAIGLMERLIDDAEEFGTIGIVAVNSKQSELIRSEFERLSAGNLSVEAYLEKCEGLGEPFFVKNLENVQGDERDFIMISLTYGREPGKKVVHQRFGPINRSQGHRRLNVLFSRARRRIGLFTSMSSADIQATETSKFGVRVLKDYLLYAERRASADGELSGKPFDSDFEYQVAARLKQRGFDVDVQVGVSKFRIDLAVKHRLHPSIYVAGVECDGASYHSSRSARDRDRLREEVLRGLGWNIVRIWSTDWFSDPSGSTDRLVREIELLEALHVRNPNDVVFGRGAPIVPVVSEPEPVEEPTAPPAPVAAVPAAVATEPQAIDPEPQIVKEPEASLLAGNGPLSEAETRRALEELRKAVIEIETPGEPYRGILRDAMIEHFIAVRFSDPSEWFDRVPTHLRQGCDPKQRNKYLGQICDVINRMRE